MKDIYLITGNPGKLAEFNDILGFELKNKKIDLDEIQSMDAKVIGKYKVMEAYEMIKAPVIVEDVSLAFHALKGMPGPFIKWFLESAGVSALPRLIKDFTNKTAEAVCTITYYDGNSLKHFEGKVQGRISDEPRGKDGFGWDSIFIPDGQADAGSQTYAEMGTKKKNKLSHRKLAIEALKQYLD